MTLNALETSRAVAELRSIALAGLARMYRPRAHRFAFRLKRTDNGLDQLEGTSDRYTAIALIGLAGESPEAVREVLHGASGRAVCEHLVQASNDRVSLGDAALMLWAACAWDLRSRDILAARLAALDPASGNHTTVDLAWALDALVTDGRHEELAGQLAARLIGTYRPSGRVFGHWPADAAQNSLRSHVACFADQVYPVHALARYGLTTDDDGAIDVAREGAEGICQRQGADGQWWWHFDARTGNVIEGYPVYSVHQDAMAPMALFAAEASAHRDFSQAVVRGLSWLARSPEIGGSLIDRAANVIWRKVARREPRKLTRGLQAVASRLHPAARLIGLDRLFPPKAIDWESRPYHLGWLLYAWPSGRTIGSSSNGKGVAHVPAECQVADAASI